jgi:hypothetical protein
VASLAADPEERKEEKDLMKKMLPIAFALVIAAGTAVAQEELNPDAGDASRIRVMMPNPQGTPRAARVVDETDVQEPQLDVVESPSNEAKFKAVTNAVNISYHGGDVINSARVVCIFWGPTWASGGSDNSRATTIQAFRNQFGTSSHYSIITQYYDSAYISTANLAGSQPDWFDTTNALPSTGNVTDSIVQQEVKRYVAAHGTNYSTVYEVFVPKYVPGTTKLVYSSDGSSTSCGGPGLAYCAYHSSYWNGSNYVKYSIEPYPSCSGCQVSGWTVAQNMEHFMCHETREAVTDPLGNAWYDSSGAEADDKCAWTGLFTENGYGYQPEWSNAINGCKQ